MITETEVWQALEHVYDPELSMSVVDLGLIYSVKIDGAAVHVTMTMTTPGCPLHDSLQWAVTRTLQQVAGVEDVNVQIVWDPPWHPGLISERGKQLLGWGVSHAHD